MREPQSENYLLVVELLKLVNAGMCALVMVAGMLLMAGA